MHGMSVSLMGVVHAVTKWVTGYAHGFRCTLVCGETVVIDVAPPEDFRILTCVRCVAEEQRYYQPGWYQAVR